MQREKKPDKELYEKPVLQKYSSIELGVLAGNQCNQNCQDSAQCTANP